jgi:hypothetical protein
VTPTHVLIASATATGLAILYKKKKQ